MGFRMLKLATFCILAVVLHACGDSSPDASTTNTPPDGKAKADGGKSTPPATEPNAEEKKSATKSNAPGIAVGEEAPQFALKNQNGEEVSLASLLAKGPVALVFYRSADW